MSAPRVIKTILLCAILCLMYLAGSILTPRIDLVTLMYQDGSSAAVKFPVNIRNDEVLARVRIDIQKSRLQTQHWNFLVDNCMQGLIINGRDVPAFEQAQCQWPKYIELDLGPWLQPGTNVVELDLVNEGGPGSIAIEPSRTRGPMLYVILALSAASVCLCCLLHKPKHLGVFGIFLSGVVLRLVYFQLNPFDYRSHDYSGHIDYIYPIVDQLRIPNANECWGCYGPPLYYVLNAAWLKLTLGSTSSSLAPHFGLHLGCLLFSIFTLHILVQIGGLVFEKYPGRWMAYTAFVGALPGLILFAPRVNNDVLLAFLAALGLHYSLKWRINSKLRELLLSGCCFALGVITKSTAVVYLTYLLALILLSNGRRILKSLKEAALVCAVSAVICVPVLVGRSYLTDSKILNSLPVMEDELHMPNSFEALTTFSPAEMIGVVYNHPYQDNSRRRYFLEYLYRSAFFGEFRFSEEQKPAAKTLLWTGIILGAFSVVGLLAAARRKDPFALPFALWGAALFGSAVAFRLVEPVVPAQDFRYVPLLVVPAGFFLAHGISGNRTALRFVQAVVLALFVLAAGNFFLQTVPGYQL